MKIPVRIGLVLLAVGLGLGLHGLPAAESTVTAAPPLSGAIFTTNMNGTRVNQNHYNDKCEVYLDGGPGDNAPQWAAGLPDGDYYFQVTDPSGKKVGIWYSGIWYAAVRFEDNNRIVIMPDMPFLGGPTH